MAQGLSLYFLHHGRYSEQSWYIQCPVCYVTQSMSLWLKDLVTLMWVGFQWVALCNESPSCWHPPIPRPPPPPPPPLVLNVCGSQSLRTNVFNNYRPLPSWQSVPRCSLHCGPLNTADVDGREWGSEENNPKKNLSEPKHLRFWSSHN